MLYYQPSAFDLLECGVRSPFMWRDNHSTNRAPMYLMSILWSVTQEGSIFKALFGLWGEFEVLPVLNMPIL